MSSKINVGSTHIFSDFSGINTISIVPGPGESLSLPSVVITNLNVTSGTIGLLNSSQATIGSLQANNLMSTSGTITNLLLTSGSIGSFQANSENITNSIITNGSISNLLVSSGSIGSLNTSIGTIGSLQSNNSYLTSSTISNLNVTLGTANNLQINFANISQATIGGLSITGFNVSSATIGSLLTTNTTNTSGTIASLLSTNLNVSSGTIASLFVTNSNITSETIASLFSTNAKITSGTVASLFATNANITSGTVASLFATNSNITSGTVASLFATNSNITSGTVASLFATNANITSGTVASLFATNANITTSSITNLGITSGTLGAFNSTSSTIGSLTVTGNIYGHIANQYNCIDARLQNTTQIPVNIFDASGATIIYLVPYCGNYISLHDGSNTWTVFPLKGPGSGGNTPTFLDVSVRNAGVYDIFCYNNSGTVTLESLVWTNVTTRATALAFQDGVYVKTGDSTRRYLGTVQIRTTNSGYDDRLTRRDLWNYYNRVSKPMAFFPSTASWTYNSPTIRQANANTSYQLNCTIGVIEDCVSVIIGQDIAGDGSNQGCIGIGNNSTTAFIASSALGTTAVVSSVVAIFNGYPTTEGSNYFSWLESSINGTPTYFGNTVLRISGIQGIIRC